MEAIKDQLQPKKEGGEQKVLMDPAVTAETDELDARFQQDGTGDEKPEETENNSANKSQNMEQFRIAVAVEGKEKLYDIRPLGDARYEIAENGEVIGTILLDEKDHARCESQGCLLDLPALHAVR